MVPPFPFFKLIQNDTMIKDAEGFQELKEHKDEGTTSTPTLPQVIYKHDSFKGLSVWIPAWEPNESTFFRIGERMIVI